MNTDIRISVSFKNHRKRAKLRMLLGDRATDYLLDLWLTVSMDRPDGNLRGLDAMDIAIMAGWSGEPQEFVKAMVDVGFLDVTTVERPLNDVTTKEYSLHDWAEHNGYACAATDRSDKSRFSRMAKTHPALYEELKQNGQESITSEEYRRLTTVERPLTNRLSPSPLPSPSPSPSKDGIEKRGGVLVQTASVEHIPCSDIMMAFNKICPAFPPATELTSVRRQRIRKLYTKYHDHDGGPLRFFDTLFKKAQASDKLAGRMGKARWCTFDWIIDEDNAVTIIEGQHDTNKRGKEVNTNDRDRAFLSANKKA